MINRLVACCCALVVVCIMEVVWADSLISTQEQTYLFKKPTITEVTLGGGTYNQVLLEGCASDGDAGMPVLPAMGARILLAPTVTVSDIKVVAEDPVLLGDGFKVLPGGRPYPLSVGPKPAVAPQPDPAVYASDAPFPQESVVRVGTYDFRGFRILTLRLQPVQYVPSSGTLAYYPKLTVIVETRDTGKLLEGYRGDAVDRSEVRKRVDNPEMEAAYPVASIDDPLYDMLILTTPDFATAFQPLADYHSNRGISTIIRTTEDVGAVDADSIRTYLQNRRFHDGFTYLLIGGDDDVIPAKDLFVMAYPGEVETAMPGDIYYACLGGTWNHDGDSNWGEPTDGVGGGDVDLVADVYVGRAPVGDETEIARFIDKTIWYADGHHSLVENVLLVGEHLGFGGVAEYGADALEELIDVSDANGFITDGFPSTLFDIDSLFDKTWAGNSWPRSELASRVNGGLHVINHLGHGLPEYAMKFYREQMLSEWLNPELCFVYSQTCLAGYFDGLEDCWAEYVTIKSDYAAFAAIMNARYGFGQEYSTDGPSHRFNRQFWDAMFGEQIRQIGPAHHDCKEDNLYRVNQECMRWCYYEMNLFGDPTIALRGGSGLSVTPGDAASFEGPHGGPFTPETIHYTLTNLGDSDVAYTALATQPWLTLSNASGTIPAFDSVVVQASIATEADSYATGRYSDLITFTNQTDHQGDTTRSVQLDIGTAGVAYEWPMNVDPGWSMEGDWAFGAPAGGAGDHGGADPTSGYTGTAVCGYNLDGGYANGMTVEQFMTTEAIDCSGLSAVELRFWRWLGVEGAEFDHARVQVSNDGQDWTTVWENEDTIDDGAWVEMTLDISEVADGQPTVYIRWGMGTTDAGWSYCGWNIDDVQIVALGAEVPALTLTLPQGVPTYMAPGPPRSIAIEIEEISESYVEGTAMLHYRFDDGAYQTMPLEHVGDGQFAAALAPPTCDAVPQYYFSAQGDGGSTVYAPKEAPGVVFTAAVGEVVLVLEDDFESNQGWTVEGSATDGQWDRGVPVDCDRGDPVSDFDGSGQCFLTDNSSASSCNSDVDDGNTTLISPPIALGGVDAEIHYALWYTNFAGDSPNSDEFVVSVSDDDGQSWTTVEVFGPASSSGWTQHSFYVGDYVEPNDEVRVAFDASDLGNGSVVEAAIDAFGVERFECVPRGSGDFDLDNDVDLRDFARFQACYGRSIAECLPGDLAGDGEVDLSDTPLFVEQLVGP